MSVIIYFLEFSYLLKIIFVEHSLLFNLNFKLKVFWCLECIVNVISSNFQNKKVEFF